MLLNLGIFLGLILLSLNLSSCMSSKLAIYPIADKDIYLKDNGDVCFSEAYFNEVLNAKIKQFK